MNQQIRRARLEDIEQIDYLHSETAFTMGYPKEILECLVAGKTMEGWNNIIQNEDFFVIADQDIIFGFVHFGEDEIFGLFIRKDKMGCGYGRALFEFAISHIPSRPVQIKSTLNAEGFYSRMGCNRHEMTLIRRRERDIYVIDMSYGNDK